MELQYINEGIFKWNGYIPIYGYITISVLSKDTDSAGGHLTRTLKRVRNVGLTFTQEQYQNAYYIK